MRAVPSVVVAAAVTGAVAAARRRKPAARKAVPAPSGAVAVPAQRRRGLDELGLQVEDIAVADHEAWDAALLGLLEA